VPRTPFLWVNASIPLTNLGSEIRTGLAAAWGTVKEDGGELVLRDSQCIVVVREGLFAPGDEGREGGEEEGTERRVASDAGRSKSLGEDIVPTDALGWCEECCLVEGCMVMAIAEYKGQQQE
jgi:hypothetical protein